MVDSLKADWGGEGNGISWYDGEGIISGES